MKTNQILTAILVIFILSLLLINKKISQAHNSSVSHENTVLKEISGNTPANQNVTIPKSLTAAR